MKKKRLFSPITRIFLIWCVWYEYVGWLDNWLLLLLLLQQLLLQLLLLTITILIQYYTAGYWLMQMQVSRLSNRVSGTRWRYTINDDFIGNVSRHRMSSKLKLCCCCSSSLQYTNSISVILNILSACARTFIYALKRSSLQDYIALFIKRFIIFVFRIRIYIYIYNQE